jgi:hypothetical protein
MWDTWIEFGGLVFWVLIALVTLVMAAQVERDRIGWAGITLVVTVTAIIGLTNSPIPALIKQHPIYLLYGFLGYLALAAVWAVIKWRCFFLPALFDRYDDIRSRFLETAGPNQTALKEFPADPAVRDRFERRSEVAILNINHKRMVSNNKVRVTSWMIYWPFSLLGTFFGDFLYRVFTAIYKGIANMLQGMSNQMASKYSELN